MQKSSKRYYWFTIWWDNLRRKEADYYEVRALNREQAIEKVKDILEYDRNHCRFDVVIRDVFQVPK